MASQEWSTPLSGVAFALCAAAVLVFGSRLSRGADALADRTGLGEVMVGSVLLGGSTSLAGIITSVSTAWQGYPQLAISNAIGGILAQTAFLALGDMFYRRANLEHAAASAESLTQGTLLIALLSIPIVAGASPEWTLAGIHPATAVLVIGYLFGLRLLRAARVQPMWWPRRTPLTREDVPEPRSRARSMPALVAGFAGCAAVVALAGLGIAQTGIELAARTGLSETAVGGLLTATATSLPELVTTIAAVRVGALGLAIGGILGGNAFDTLFLAFADAAYREGSLYHRFTSANLFILSQAILMSAVLLLGLLRRQTFGIGGIGFESALILLLYAAGVAVMATS